MIAITKRKPQSGCYILIVCTLLLMASGPAHAQSPSKTAAEGKQAMSKILDSVVRITTRDQSLAVLNESLGLIISDRGLIITNSLAIKDAYIATAMASDGSSYFIESVMAKDITLDLALLRIRSQQLPAIKLADGVTPPEGSSVYALKSWKEKDAELITGQVSKIWQTADKIDMVDFGVVLGGKGIGGPVVTKDGQLAGISNTVTRPFRRGSVGDTAICSTQTLSTFVKKNTTETGIKLASAFSGAFGPDGANKLVKIWKYLEDEQHENALRELRIMPSLLQEAYVYLITLGLTEIRLKQYEAAAKTFLNASQANPYDANPGYHGGLALRGAKKYDKSILAFHVATQRDPQHIEAYIAMGRSYNAMQQPSLAIDVLSQALSIDSNNVDAHLNIGISYWGMSNKEQTLEHLMQASMISPKSPAGLRATALMDTGLPMPNEQ